MPKDRLLSSLMLVAISAFSGARGEEPDEAPVIRARPPSTGEVVIGILRPQNTEVAGVWRRALLEGDPQARAAAARAVHVSKADRFVGIISTVLRSETDYQAAREEAAALASMAGPEEDPTILDAGKRLGDQALSEMALILARVRRSDAIGRYFEQVEPALEKSGRLQSFLRLATSNDGGALMPVAEMSLQSGRREVWLAALDVWLESDVGLDTRLLNDALRRSPPEIAADTAWRLARAIATNPELCQRAAVADLASNSRFDPPVGGGASDIDLAFGLELLGRVLGRDAVTNEAWLEYLNGSRSSRVDSTASIGSLVSYFTNDERKALKKRFHRLIPAFDFPQPRPKRSSSSSPAPKVSTPITRLANGYPPGFISGVLETGGCSLDAGPLLGEATITFDDRGRPDKVRVTRLVTRAPAPACADPMTAIFAATLEPEGDLSEPGTPHRYFLMLEKGYVSRLEAPPFHQQTIVRMGMTDAERVEPPKRVHWERPVYPPAAQLGKKEGRIIIEIVVSREGMVTDIELLKQTEDVFVAPTFEAVSRWRYAPATEGGRPVSVYLTVIVDFSLK